MKKIVVKGGKRLQGEVTVSGSKNVVLKAIVAACLTDEEVELKNIPLIQDVFIMLDLIKEIGGEYSINDHSVKIQVKNITTTEIPLEMGAKIRTSSLFIAPLLIRKHEAIISNPGGCRIGARPIDRTIKGLEAMGAHITYKSEDGYFHATCDGLVGAEYSFEKNSHTGTETLILASVLAKGATILRNAALESEVDDLIVLLNAMGAKVRREENRTIVIDGVKTLHGTTYTIIPDSNEIVTFAICSALTGGNIVIKDVDVSQISAFIDTFQKAGGAYETINKAIRFYIPNGISPTDVVTQIYPGFKTDWQSPWAVLMTQADGVSTIHEAIYENRFGYAKELEKMGGKLELFTPKVDNPADFYNFNWEDNKEYKQGLRVYGRTNLHNGVLTISDLRAGATLVLASLLAKGESIIYGVEHLERGYENFDGRLRSLGADITISKELK